MRWNMGVDLGTRNVRMAATKDEPCLSAPSAILFREGSEKPLAMGEPAWQLFGKNAPEMQVCFPMRDGALANNLYAEKILEWLMERSGEKRPARRMNVLLTCAPFARPVQKEALLMAALDAGAGEAALVSTDLASAVGAGVKVNDPVGRLVVDMGAGKITATLFTRGLVAARAHLPYGMNRVDERVAQLLQTRAGFLVGPRTACEIKEALAHATDPNAGVPVRVAGIHAAHRLPEYAEVAPSIVAAAMEDVLRAVVEMCQSVIDNAPEELAADLNDSGCVLVGGGANMPGLDKYLGDRLGVPCKVAPACAECGILGLREIIDDPEPYERLLMQKMIKNVRH